MRASYVLASGGAMRRLALLAALLTARAAGALASPLDLGPADRLLVLAPHPDDELVGCGGMIQRALAAGAAVRVVFLTYGDGNEWSFTVYRRHPVVAPDAVRRMGLLRHDEAVAAARAVGLEPDRLIFLGYPDFGTFAIWTSHWGDRPPYRSLLTRATAVPYANARRPGAPYRGEDILDDLTAIIRAERPTVILVSHPADHNPDHRALYLFTRVALFALPPAERPALLPYLVHYPRWPAPRGWHDELPLAPPAPLADQVRWERTAVPPAARARTRTALGAHRTQMRYSADYLLSFVRANELFGDFPDLPLGGHGAAQDMTAPVGTREPPDQLTDAERSQFVGLAWRSASVEDGRLVLSTHLSRPLGRAVEVAVYVFGQRADRSFAAMPKLRVELGVVRTAVFDQDRPLPAGTATVTRRARELDVSVSLGALGDPERVLVSGRTSLAELPLDTMPWRVLELRGGNSDRAAP